MYKIIKFYSDSCAPCKAMSPIFDDVAEEMSDNEDIVFGSTNIGHGDNRAVAQSFGVRGIPAFVVIKDHQAIGMKNGAMPKEVLKDFITKTIEEAK